MKKAHLVILAALALVASLAFGTAYAADNGGVYVGVKGGYEYKDISKKGVGDSNAAATNNNATNQSWSSGDGGVFGGSIGYNFADMGLPVRAEVEYLHHEGFKYSATNSTTGVFNNKVDNIHTVFANFYYDIKTGTAFTPYVGAGLGVAWLDQKYSSTFTGWTAATDNGSKSFTNFAWNLGAGVGYSVTDNIILDLGYRYSNLGETKSVASANNRITLGKQDISTHEGLLGLRYQF
jgi:outer membrane immunogenic protein